MKDLRQRFIEFFQQRNHLAFNNHHILCKNDPTLLFVNSGMAVLKDYFLGNATPPAERLVSCQPCLRVGGKHNDLDEVGKTTRHHTFFEMLGNFSFGSYGRELATEMAWDFLTKELKLDEKKLYVTVHPKDIKSREAWAGLGVPNERILSVEENLWAAGDLGPRGYCTEIFYDFGDQYPGQLPGEGDSGTRYIEIWNIVLMEQCAHEGGVVVDLPKPCIDTGMGLERIQAALLGSPDTYDSPVIKSLIDYGSAKIQDTLTLRIMADHVRAIVFMIADGLEPSPSGAGYVLRRVMRRAMRHAIQAGAPEVLGGMSEVVIDQMKDFYPNLQDLRSYVRVVIDSELEKFKNGWAAGYTILDSELKKLKEGKLPGTVAFTLYDTYGFPLDLTQSICEERNIKIDLKQFEREMNLQRSRSSKSLGGKFPGFQGAEVLQKTQFVGYDEHDSESQIIALFDEKGLPCDRLKSGGWIVLDKTPFYAESGGQASDTGFIKNFAVTDVQKLSGVWFHKTEQGDFRVKENVVAVIDKTRRAKLRTHHSGTHLVVAAIKKSLPKTVICSSAVGEDKFRVDFTSSKNSIEQGFVKSIENSVNLWIKEDLDCIVEVMPFEKAIDIGADKIPGKTYPDKVRVVTFGNKEGVVDVQLCGGTHVRNTSELVGLKILEMRSISSNVTRLVCKAGISLFEHILLSYCVQTEKKKRDQLEINWKVHRGSVCVTYAIAECHPTDALTLLDREIEKTQASFGLLVAHSTNGASILCKSVNPQFSAKDIVLRVAKNGRGGGNATRAQAGGISLDDATEGLNLILSQI